MNWQGTWDSVTSYAVDDVVEHNGSSWIAVSANSNSAPSDSSSDWDLVARQGVHGGGFTFAYTFDSSTTDGDPGNGKLRFNSLGSGVTKLYMDNVSAELESVNLALLTMDDSSSPVKGKIRITHANDPTKFVILELSGVLQSGSPSYQKLPVTYRDGSFSFPFSDGDPVVFSFTRTGDVGDNPNTVTPGGRLTYVSGDPLPEGNIWHATTLYYTPYRSNVIPIYNGTTWKLYTFNERSISLPSVAETMHDVFAYFNGSTVELELVAWTNDTTRATSLAYQDGILVKSGAATRRYLGTLRTHGTAGYSHDGGSHRLLFNEYNRQPRRLANFESGTWTINSTSWRQFNSDSDLQVQLVLGTDAAFVDLSIMAHHELPAGEESFIGIGFNTTTVPTSVSVDRESNPDGANSKNTQLHARWVYTSGAARFHELNMLEKSSGGAVCKNDFKFGFEGYALI